MSRKATRQDVARLAGVSGATVSRVYNHPDQVEEATRKAVLDSARTLGFIPDRNASALRRQTSGVILLVEVLGQYEYDWAGQREYHAFFGDIIRALMHHAGSHNRSIQLLSVQDPSEIPALGCSVDFDGILGFGIDSPQAARALQALGKPLVVCHHTEEVEGIHRVSTDNCKGGALSARYLWDSGGRRALFAGDYFDRVGSHRRRMEGFQRAWPQGGVQVMDGCLGLSGGRQAGPELASLVRAGQVDCIGAVNDLTALGLYQGLRDQGLQVPGDCLICGYDNLPLFRDLCPLPTIESHLDRIYLKALELLQDLISQGNADLSAENEPWTSFLLSPELVPPSS